MYCIGACVRSSADFGLLSIKLPGIRLLCSATWTRAEPCDVGSPRVGANACVFLVRSSKGATSAREWSSMRGLHGRPDVSEALSRGRLATPSSDPVTGNRSSRAVTPLPTSNPEGQCSCTWPATLGPTAAPGAVMALPTIVQRPPRSSSAAQPITKGAQKEKARDQNT